MEEHMTLEDWLDDLCVRFILNLPEEDLGSIPHICFQIEEAHWFYEDFIRVLDPALPHMSLKDFCLRMFQHCPLFANYSIEHHIRAYQEFMQYKTRIPVRGAIMLNHEMDSCVLVRGWKSNATWSFPRGKINKDETDLDCAVRECWEETGFDLRKAGLVPSDDEVKFFDITMRDQHLRMFVFRDVPMDTVFEPQTRNEIGKVAWYNLRDLPAFRKKKAVKQNEGNGVNAIPNASKFYNVAPFLVPLKKWVLSQKKKDIPPQVLQDDVFANADIEELEAAIPHFQEASDRAVEQGLRGLLQVQEESETAQNGNNHGAALLSMLQSKEAPEFQNQYPHTPLEQTISQPSQPQSPHYHHQVQRLPHHGAFENPPQFPVASQSHMNNNNNYHQPQAPIQSQPQYHPQNHPQQYQQARPQVHMSADAQGYQNVMVSPRQYQTQPQLLHPQPQPPQVQQALLMRGMLGTPGQVQPPQQLRPGPVQGTQHIAHQHQHQHQQQQPNPFAPSHLGSAPRVQAQPSAHSMGLLNMFKDKGAQENSPNPVIQPKPLNQQDRHRSGLLDMFKQGEQTTPTTRPDLNLPFGALSIAQRPMQQAGGGRGVTATDMSIAGAPDPAALPLPNKIIRPRQGSSTEQKSQLLSLFSSKGKDLVPASPMDIARPRSRVASIASAHSGSRRGSQTPTSLTPADQNFLLNFLKNASKPQR